MKENSIKNERSSIEEYVKILERFSNENVIYGSTVGMTLEKYKDLQLSAEHILSDYKRVLKENETLKNFVSSIFNEDIEKDYIPVQRIKDKIEELDNQQKQWLEDRELKASNREIIFARDVLQGLLEEGEKNG